ncbi:MAG: leucyl aminopeptidase [Bdellovibrio sp.]|nr:leucyl aminopeptidase [Bdellovibrio sp.]
MADSHLLEVRTSISGQVDTVIVAVFQDSGKKAIPPQGQYQDIVEKLRKNGTFTASFGSIQFIRFGGVEPAENVLFIGMGPSGDLSPEKLRQAGAFVAVKLKAEKCGLSLLDLKSVTEAGSSEISAHQRIKAFGEGFALSQYRFDKYRAKESKDSGTINQLRLVVIAEDKKEKAAIQKEIDRVNQVVSAVALTRDWSNEPSNFGTPEYFAEEAKSWGRKNGLKVRVLTEKDAAREKMGLFLGVGKGSERESRVVVLEYQPKNKKNAKTVALVGKGVTFDSGGVSLKAGLRMEDMKHDMTGAATVMGAILIASQWQVPHRVIAVLAFVENMPDGDAIQPGNVLTSRNGKTVEVINTDAEGRLVLADALDLVQDFEPDAVIDVATLTGAVSIALGKHCCAVLGNEQTLIDALCRSGNHTGERIWQLPLFDEYLEDLKSDYADLKNSANDTLGGTIRGAMFLKQFVRKNVKWAHLDIASTGYNMGHIPYYPKKGASGAFVRTLAQFIADF